MKNEVRLLRKVQKSMWDAMYPGYPYQLTVVIDLEEKKGYLNWCGRKMGLDNLLRDINAQLIYQCLGAYNTDKRTFLVDQHLEEYKKYLDYEEDDFYFDNLMAVKFYFALNSAIYNHKKGDKGFIFGVIDCDCDYVDVEVFYKEEDIQKFVEEYFPDEDAE